MKAVINSSPLVSLSLVGQPDLLPKLFDEVIVPKSVYNEVVAKGKGKTGSEEPESIGRFTVLEAGNKALVNSIMLELDEGEAEVIAIAKEYDIQNVIIDEFAGRQYASMLGLNVTGTLGILLVSKELGFINEVKPLMDIMLKHNRYINRKLYLAGLRKANEI